MWGPVDIPKFLEQDDVFLNLIDRPKVLVSHEPTIAILRSINV